METVRRLSRLLRHPPFRRMVLVRIITQGADATVQVAMASYILFNPQNQPNAWAIAGVIALVMLPFSFIGPFLGPLLDAHWRTRTVVWCDAIRLVAAFSMAAIVGLGLTNWTVALFVLLLVALSLNRLQLAALGAGLPHVVSHDEYLDASSISPMIGPVAAVAFGGLAGAIRIIGANWLESWQCDGIVFAWSGIMFALGIWGMRGFARESLGPKEITPARSFASTVRGLVVAARHIAERVPAAQGFAVLISNRAAYGFLMTSIIVMYKNVFAPDSDAAAMVGIGVWFAASGVGFAMSGAVCAPLSTTLGLRRTLVAMLGASAVFQAFPAGLLQPVPLVVAGFLLGVCAQSIKICTDTMVQAHVDDEPRGRVMVLYDIINNLGLVIGATVAAMLLPADGRSLVCYLGISGWFVVVAVCFWLTSRSRASIYNRGTTLEHD